jgi:hypothetical protein
MTASEPKADLNEIVAVFVFVNAGMYWGHRSGETTFW